LQNGREAIVRITDRGPFVGERLIDLSRAAAQVLGFETAGQARVHVRYLGPAPRRVNGDGGDAPLPLAAPPEPVDEQSDGAPTSLVLTQPATPAYAPPMVQEISHQQTQPLPEEGRFVVQVGAFSDLANAHRVRDAVSAAGPVTIDVRRSSAGLELFRVRVGPWASAEAADRARQELASRGFSEAVVTQR
jgi:rare lipoprotein A